jgi:hypothetical protein
MIAICSSCRRQHQAPYVRACRILCPPCAAARLAGEVCDCARRKPPGEPRCAICDVQEARRLRSKRAAEVYAARAAREHAARLAARVVA